MSETRRSLDGNVEAALRGFDPLALSASKPGVEPTPEEIAAALGAMLRLVGLMADAVIRIADALDGSTDGLARQLHEIDKTLNSR